MGAINGFGGILLCIHLNFLEHVRKAFFKLSIQLAFFMYVANIIIEIIGNWENRKKIAGHLKEIKLNIYK